MLANVKEIADQADMIINGYVFIKDGEYIRVITFLKLLFVCASRYKLSLPYRRKVARSAG